jgi:hypothetical protein
MSRDFNDFIATLPQDEQADIDKEFKQVAADENVFEYIIGTKRPFKFMHLCDTCAVVKEHELGDACRISNYCCIPETCDNCGKTSNNENMVLDDSNQ